MDFSLTTVFVVPAGNTIPTSGSTQDLAAKQLGIFNADWTASTAGNIVNQPYIYIAQGRSENLPGLATKKSDKIAKTKVVEWYKVVSEADLLPQVTEVSAFTIQCGEDISLTLRLHANYIDSGFFNGLTRSVTIKAPCCACGADPCTVLDPQAMVDDIIAKAKLDTYLNKYLTFQRIGASTTSILRITGNLLDKYANPCDVAAYPAEYDRLWFHTFIYPGAETTQDFLTVDNCDLAGTVAVKQRATFLRGSSDEIKQLEKNYYSYQSTFKHLFRMAGYNGGYESIVVDGTFYDTYYIKFLTKENDDYTFVGAVPQDETVILAFPAGGGTSFETIMTAYLGAPTNNSATDRTTTTTTSTTTTSTTSTTVLNP